MGPILTILLPIILKELPKLLESLVKKNDHAVKAGYEGPLTAWVNAVSAGKSDGECFHDFCDAYCRCCKDAHNPA